MPLVLDIDTMWFPPRQLSPVWGIFVDSGRGDQPCFREDWQPTWLWLFYQKKDFQQLVAKSIPIRDLSDLSTTFGMNNDHKTRGHQKHPKTVPPTWHLWCLGKMVSPPAWRKIHKVGPSKIRRKEHDIEQDSMESDGKKKTYWIYQINLNHILCRNLRKSIVSPTFQPSPLPRKGPLPTHAARLQPVEDPSRPRPWQLVSRPATWAS